MARGSAHLRERALGMLQGLRTADVARTLNCNVRTVRRLRQHYRETGRQLIVLAVAETTCNNTCAGLVHPNITPAGQVQDGNNNCPN